MAKPKTEDEGNVLVTAAKAIGKAAGKVAAVVGAEAEATPVQKTPKQPKTTGRLEKKNKSRLPRREKKARKKALDANRGA